MSVQVMIERGKRKRTVAVAFEWPGWDRSGRTEDAAMATLEAYRSRYAVVAARAGQGTAFDAAGEFSIVERLEGIGMTDYYGVSGRPATRETQAMTEPECERKIALLEAAWATFDDAAARVTPDLRLGPRGGGRDRDAIVRHVHGAEIDEYGKKVGVRTSLEALGDPAAIRAHRAAMVAGIRATNARGPAAGAWTVQFLIRRCAWHALDHVWELEDRDLTVAGG